MSKGANDLVRKMSLEVSTMALALERRWTYAALKRTDADVARRLEEQRDLFIEACISGRARDVKDQGDALVRGYQVAIDLLTRAAVEDDAYMLGSDLVTGLKVAIGQQRAAVARIREVHGEKVIWVTPDEVARMLAGMESFKTIGAVKRLFPGAEILDRHEEQPREGVESAEGEELAEDQDD